MADLHLQGEPTYLSLEVELKHRLYDFMCICSFYHLVVSVAVELNHPAVF